MKEIRSIIIEDEKPAIEELKYVLSKYNFFKYSRCGYDWRCWI